MEYLQWQSEDSTISWCQDARGKWKKYTNAIFNEEYALHHLVSTNTALILQDSELKYLAILEEEAAYKDGEKFATGLFGKNGSLPSEFDEWKGDDNSGARFLFRKIYSGTSHHYESHEVRLKGEPYKLVHEFLQPCLVSDSESVVILYNKEKTTVVLTDTCAYCYNKNGEKEERQGKWKKSCNWSGKVNNGQVRTDFLKISPTKWEGFQIGRREIATYQHIQDIESKTSIIVNNTPCIVIDFEHIYEEGTIIANGSWESTTWNENSSESVGQISVEKKENRCYMMKNSEQSKPVRMKYVEVNTTQPGTTAIMRGEKVFCILEEFKATINGSGFASGSWKHTSPVYSGQDKIIPIQFILVPIPEKGEKGKKGEKEKKERVKTQTSGKLQRHAERAIERLQLHHVLKTVRQTLLEESTVRIDMQETMDTGGVLLHNIQVQINTVPRNIKNCGPTTIAHVNVPDTARYIEDVRYALNKSLKDHISYVLQESD